MKMSIQKLMDATLIVADCIREDRAMPQKGKYRLARMHAKLFPEFNTINSRRDAMITAYGYHQRRQEPDPANLGQTIEVETKEWQVPPDKNDEFNAQWLEIAKDEIEVDIQPIPLAYLDMGSGVDGAFSANELIILGDLVTE